MAFRHTGEERRRDRWGNGVTNPRGSREGRVLDALTTIIEKTAAKSGQEYLEEVVHLLADATRVRAACVGEVIAPDRRRRMKVRAVWGAPELLGVECSFALRAAESAVGHGLFCCPSSLRECFPEARPLVSLGFESFVGMPLKDSGGQLSGMLALMHDRDMEEGNPLVSSLLTLLAPRAAAELERLGFANELSSRARRLNSIFRAAPIGIGVASRGIILEVNERLCEMTGYSRDELLNRHCRLLYTSDEESVRIGRIEYDAAVEPGIGMTETRWRRKDGVLIDVLLSSAPLAPGDLAAGVTFTALDLTARKQAEEARRFTEYVVDHGGDPALWSDTDDRFFYVNEAACRLLGYTHEELLAMRVGDISPDYAAPERNWEELRRRRSVMVKTAVRRKDGTFVPVEVSANYVLFGDRECNCAFLRDLRERQGLEAQLRQAQKMEAIGQLAGGVAHDFNNQLTVIAGYTEMLELSLPRDDSSHALLAEIRRATERAHALTSSLLTLSRKKTLHSELLNLNEVLAGMRDPLSRMLGERIDTRMQLAGGLPPVCLDRAQLEQAVMNLVVNARDAMPHGGNLFIETANVAADDPALADKRQREGAHVVVAVRDDGVGMDEKTVSQVFEPFFTTKAPGHGTGLGLPVVQSFVTQSGGFVTVETECGRGTTFRLFFPGETQREVKEPEVRAGPAPRPRDGTVLVAEDDQAVRQLVVGVLRAQGYQVLQAANGTEALELQEQTKQPIGLLVTDVVMPGMSGTELAAQIAAVRPDTTTLYISGYPRRGQDNAPDLPEECSLEKPFTPAQLLAKVAGLLERPLRAARQ